jgi:hypothetical protein
MTAMKHAAPRILGSLVLLAALLLASPGLALAGGARTLQFHNNSSADFSFPSCDGSFTITGHVDDKYHEIDYFDPAAGLDANGDAVLTKVEHSDVSQGTWTNLANGKSLSFFDSDHFSETATAYLGEVPYPAADSGFGVAYTLTWRERGVPIKIKTPQGKTISVDAGLIITPDVQIVVYYVGGQQQADILSLGDADVRGPHPLFGTDRFCEITNQYLS